MVSEVLEGAVVLVMSMRSFLIFKSSGTIAISPVHITSNSTDITVLRPSRKPYAFDTSNGSVFWIGIKDDTTTSLYESSPFPTTLITGASDTLTGAFISDGKRTYSLTNGAGSALKETGVLMIGFEGKLNDLEPLSTPSYFNFSNVYADEDENKEIVETYRVEQSDAVDPISFTYLSSNLGIFDSYTTEELFLQLFSAGVDPVAFGWFAGIMFEAMEAGIEEGECRCFTEPDPDRNLTVAEKLLNRIIEGVYSPLEYPLSRGIKDMAFFIKTGRGVLVPYPFLSPVQIVNVPSVLPYTESSFSDSGRKAAGYLRKLFYQLPFWRELVLLLKAALIKNKGYRMPPEGRAAHFIEVRGFDPVKWYYKQKDIVDRYLPTLKKEKKKFRPFRVLQ